MLDMGFENGSLVATAASVIHSLTIVTLIKWPYTLRTTIKGAAHGNGAIWKGHSHRRICSVAPGLDMCWEFRQIRMSCDKMDRTQRGAK